MPVSGVDLHLYKSASGSSDGGAISVTEIVSGVLNNLFPSFSEAERVAGDTEIKAFFMQNEHATDSLLSPIVWFSISPDGETAELAVHKGDAGATDKTLGTMTAFSGNAVAALVSDGADTRTVTLIGLDGTGLPGTEDVVLTGAAEVLSVNTWSLLYAAHTTTSVSRTITIKQGSGGTTRGTIGTGAVETWLWRTVASKPTGIKLVDLPAAAAHGFWMRVVVPPGSTGARENGATFACEEGV